MKKTSKVKRRLVSEIERFAALLLGKLPLDSKKFAMPPAYFAQFSKDHTQREGWRTFLVVETKRHETEKGVYNHIVVNAQDYSEEEMLFMVKALHERICDGILRAEAYLLMKSLGMRMPPKGKKKESKADILKSAPTDSKVH